MTSDNAVDPELIAALRQIPVLDLASDRLGELRSSMQSMRASAPEAADVTVEEHWATRPDGSSLRLLVYSPTKIARTGCLLWIHGGGMVMGFPEFNEAQSRFLAQQAGCVVVSPQYRLAPEHPYPGGLEDCYTSLQWINATAEAWSISGGRIAIAGESGGGCLAAGLALLARDRGEFAISAQFLQYPMLDDRTGTDAEPRPLAHAGELVWTKASNREAWTAVLGPESGRVDVPIYAAPGRTENLSGLPPTFVSVGDLDLFVGENIRYVLALIQNAVPAELHLYPGAFHGFMIFGGNADVAERARREFWGAIERHFRGSTATARSVGET